MLLYYSIFFGLLVLSNTRQYRDVIFNVLIIAAIVFYAIRGEYIGQDTVTYAHFYEAQKYGHLTDHYEFLYGLLFKILHSYGAPVWVMQGACGILTMIPLAMFIKRTNVNPILALFFYYALFAYLYSLSAARQMIAVSFVLLAYTYYPSNKKKTILLILIAFGFHASSIISFVVFLLPFIKMRGIVVWALLVISFVIGLFINESLLIYLMGPYSIYLTDSYLANTNGFRDEGIYPIIMAFVLNVLFILVNNSANNELKSTKWFKIFYFMILFDNLTFRLLLGTRLLLYFSMVQCVLYPMLFHQNIERKPILIKSTILLYVLVYFTKMFLGVEEFYSPYYTVFDTVQHVRPH